MGVVAQHSLVKRELNDGEGPKSMRSLLWYCALDPPRVTLSGGWGTLYRDSRTMPETVKLVTTMLVAYAFGGGGRLRQSQVSIPGPPIEKTNGPCSDADRIQHPPAIDQLDRAKYHWCSNRSIGPRKSFLLQPCIRTCVL